MQSSCKGQGLTYYLPKNNTIKCSKICRFGRKNTINKNVISCFWHFTWNDILLLTLNVGTLKDGIRQLIGLVSNKAYFFTFEMVFTIVLHTVDAAKDQYNYILIGR